MKQLDFLREMYQRATTRPFGYLLIVFGPQTSESYVLAQILLLVNRLPSIFHHQLQRKRFYQTSEKQLHIVKHWQENKKRKDNSRQIHDCDSEQIEFSVSTQ